VLHHGEGDGIAQPVCHRAEVAALLRVSNMTVYGWYRRGAPCRAGGAVVRIREEDVDRYLAGQYTSGLSAWATTPSPS